MVSFDDSFFSGFPHHLSSLMNAPHVLLTVISIHIIYDLIGNYSLNVYSPLFTDISPDLMCPLRWDNV